MIRRRFLRQFVACLMPVGTLAAVLGTAAVAQQRGSSTPPREGQRPKAERPQQQPLLRQNNIDPKLLAVLQGWENSSKLIKSLQGSHQRWVYDKVFEVEKRAQGVFYYEDPDKGRIDIAPPKTVPAVNKKKLGKNGKPFKVQKDREERWVCDGKRILQINDQEKTAEEYPIPPNARGRNIMNGPLPFLFGMPVKTALARYKLTLISDSESKAVLRAIPRWKTDAQNYSEAKIILNKKFQLAGGLIGGKKKFLFVPEAVQLNNPAGTLETVYFFTKLEVNKGKGGLRNLFSGDPFAPRLKGYKITRNDPGKRVPQMVGLDYKEVTKRLTKAGLKDKKDFRFALGVPATDPKQVYVVYKQSPPANSALKPGKTIVFTLYDKMVTSTRKPAPRRN